MNFQLVQLIVSAVGCVTFMDVGNSRISGFSALLKFLSTRQWLLPVGPVCDFYKTVFFATGMVFFCVFNIIIQVTKDDTPQAFYQHLWCS